MRRLNRVVVLAVSVLLVAAMGAGTGCQRVEAALDHLDAGVAPMPGAHFALRQVAQGTPPATAAEVVQDRHGQALQLTGPAIATIADVRAVKAADDIDGIPVLDIRFRDEAHDRIHASMEAAIGQRIAILIDGRVITVATVAGAFGKAARISGLDGRAERDRLYASLTGTAPPAQ